MKAVEFVYYRDGDFWIGWLEDFPDYRTQGRSLRELKENLKDMHAELTGGHIACVRRVGKLLLA